MTRTTSGLYVIIDPDACAGRSALDVARLALEGGTRAIQWRDKRRDKGEQLADVRAIARICREYDVPFIVNDHADLARAVGGDGLHLGQTDLPIAAARPIVGAGTIVGVSTNNADEARLAEAAGADYVAIGAIFPTGSKSITRAASLSRITEVRAAVRVPVVAIGGITTTNAASVIAAGADAIAVISAVCAAPDPRAAAAELAAAFPVAPPIRAPSSSAALPSRTDPRRRIVDAYLDALNRRDRAAFLALFAPDAAQHDPLGEPPRIGRTAIGAWWDAGVTIWDEFRIEARNIFLAGNGAALEWTITEAQADQERRFSGVDIITIAGNEIASVHAYWERTSLPDFAPTLA